jgi:putative transposase
MNITTVAQPDNSLTKVEFNGELMPKKASIRTPHTAVGLYKKLTITTEHVNEWQQATQKQQKVARSRKVIITEFEALHALYSFSKAVSLFKDMVMNASVTSACLNALRAINPKVKAPSGNTLKNWIDAYNAVGLSGLLPLHKGSQRKSYGWEHIALTRYHRPQKPSIKKVARELREEHGFANATDANVWYFLSNLPADLGDKSRWRVGTKLYRDGQRTYQLRDTECLAVGQVFQGDGHRCDVYLQHPKTGKIKRFELTVFQDWKSRYIVGWYLDSDESAITTMATLSHGMGTFNHVPQFVYIDNGSGFKSKLMNDAVAGFYQTFSIEGIFAIPGNAKGKGNVERFFRTMEEDFNKDFDTYCGKDMSEDISRHFSGDKMHILKKKGIHVPTIEEWEAAFAHWLTKYHNRPHPEYKGETPASMWATLDNNPVHDMDLLVRPREQVKVTRGSFKLHQRQYNGTNVHQFNNSFCIAEYDLHDDSSVRLFDLDGRYLLTAYLATKKPALDASRMVDRARLSAKGKEKRLLNKLDTSRQENAEVMPAHEQQLDELSTLELATEPETLTEQGEPTFDLNELYNDTLELEASSPEDDFDKFDVELID